MSQDRMGTSVRVATLALGACTFVLREFSVEEIRDLFGEGLENSGHYIAFTVLIFKKSTLYFCYLLPFTSFFYYVLFVLNVSLWKPLSWVEFAYTFDEHFVHLCFAISARAVFVLSVVRCLSMIGYWVRMRCSVLSCLQCVYSGVFVWHVKYEIYNLLYNGLECPPPQHSPFKCILSVLKVATFNKSNICQLLSF